MQKINVLICSALVLPLVATGTEVLTTIDLSTATASQSSSHNAGPAGNGIDGVLGNFTHTLANDANPSWTVVMAQDETFETIYVHNRDNCCADRLSDITVQVFDSGATEIFNSGVLNPGNALGSPAFIEVTPPGAPITARSLTVSRDGASTIGAQGVLSIGELQLGTTSDVILPAGSNLTQSNILNMTTAQSSNYNTTFVSGLAVDGNTGNFTHTAGGDANAWWEVDFGEDMLLEDVVIDNRSSCCGQRLRDITITVYNSAGKAAFTSALLNPGNALAFPDGGASQLSIDLEADNGGVPVYGRKVVISRTADPNGADANDANVLSLGEVTVIGGSDPLTDSDNDNLSDAWEIANGLNVGVDDSGVDEEPDGLTNLQEYNEPTDPQDADTDDDGLDDGPEATTHGSNPRVADTDGDGLLDGAEINEHGSSPLLVDTDNDGFSDPLEVAENTDPDDPNDKPFLTIVEVRPEGLVGGDITDPEDDGVKGPGIGSGFAWSNITASEEAYFHGNGGNQGAFDVFDNSLDATTGKWCCGAPPVNVTVDMGNGYSLTSFTVSSANDVPARDPVDWAIQGSNDGVTWTNIYPVPGSNDVSADYWAARNQTILFTLPAPSVTYRMFRYQVNSTVGNVEHQTAEVELFGMIDNTDSDEDGMPDWYEDSFAFLESDDDFDAGIDQDQDGLTNLEEYQFGSNPGLADADGDGLEDGDEKANNSNPNVADTDGDLFPDGLEVARGSEPDDAGSLPMLNPIAWGGAQNITGMVSDIETMGTLVAAYSGGGSSVTVGPVLFEADGPPLGARFTAFDPYDRGQDLAYEDLLATGEYNAAPRLITLDGLTPGENYLVQVWVTDTRDCCPGRVRQFTTDPTYSDFAQIGEVNSGVFGDEVNFPGQYVIGTFTADAEVQHILASGLTGGSQYNALMVRHIPQTAATVEITGFGFNGGAFDVTGDGFDTGAMYQLSRSLDLEAFTAVDGPFMPATSEHTASDPSPPEDEAYYRFELFVPEVP